MSFRLKKEGNSAICDNMDETGGHPTEWNVRHRKANSSWYDFYAESKDGESQTLGNRVEK